MRMDKWAARLDAGVRHSIVDTSPRAETVGAPGRDGVTVNFGDILVPNGERVSAEIARKQRQLAEIGVFSA
jgi:hypothetical protein